MSIKVQIVTRIRLVIIFMVLFAMGIIYRIIHLQFIDNEIWVKKQERAHIRVLPIKATRGNILSSEGGLLATSLPFYRVAFDPTVSNLTQEKLDIYKNGLDSLSIHLSRFFGDHSAKYYRELIVSAKSHKRRYLLLNKRQINFAEKKVLEKWPIFRDGKVDGGIIFEKVERRFMPYGGLAARTIGKIKLTDKLIKGQFGLEYSFNDELSGVDGKQLFSKIGGGVWEPTSEDYIVNPRQGHDLATTIDVNIQDFAENAVRNCVRDNEADHGCAIVMEVATGDIKALVNIDQVKMGDFVEYREVYNWAVGRNSEPGSTMKLASVIALMEEYEDITSNTKIETGKGSTSFFDIEMKDSKKEGHGTITLREAFKYSSNIGIAKMVNDKFYHQRQLQQRFVDYLQKFHLTDPIDFQLQGSAVPHVKSPDSTSWSGISLPWMSIGYEVEISPLQILAFYNAIANDGYYVKPRIVTDILEDGKVLRSFSVDKSDKMLCSENTLKSVRDMLWSVVNEEGGTAYSQRSSQFSMSGKTGTKQNLKAGRYVHEYYATFAGFFPSEKPKYSIIVAIDNPKKGKYYGSDIAAPVFKAIADKIYKNDLALHPFLNPVFQVEKGSYPDIKAGYYQDLKVLCDQFNLKYWGGSNELWVKPVKDGNLKEIKWQDLIVNEEKVPDVVGMSFRDAITLLENSGMKVVFEGRGKVTSQSISPGSILVVGSKIKITLR